jgi:thiamine-phosphate pyrophosphorylase
MIDKLQYISQAPSGVSHLKAIETALRAGCRWIQLRIKDEAHAYILEEALAAKALCNQYGGKLIVNDHPDIALAVGAYGLHLGLGDMPIPAARDMVGPDMIIGGTANTFEHICLRVNEGANYVGLGPFRFTATKKNLSPILGATGYRAIFEEMHKAGFNVPIIAIGGILPDDVAGLVETGIYGVALSGAITAAKDAPETVKQLQETLNNIILTK